MFTAQINLTHEQLKKFWTPQRNSISFEDSEIEGCSEFVYTKDIKEDVPKDAIVIRNSNTGKYRIFKLINIDRDGSGEDIYGHRYKSDDGIKLLIIND